MNPQIEEIFMIYTSIPKSKQKKVPKAKQEQYDAWLKSHQPKNVILNKKISFKRVDPVVTGNPYVRKDVKIASLDTGFKGALTKTGIMKDYHRLSESDRKIVDHLSNCVAPIHKSSYVYVSEGMNPSSLGRKNEVL
jgi:hypothetical protein